MSEIHQIICKEIMDCEVAGKVTEAIKDVLVKRLERIKKPTPKSDCWLDWDATDFIHEGANQAITDAIKAIREG